MNPSAAPSSSPSSSSHGPQKVHAASTADWTLSSADSPIAPTANSPVASIADSAAPLAESSPPPRFATVATSANLAIGVDSGCSLHFAKEEPKQAVDVAMTVSSGIPVVGQRTLAAAHLKPSPSLDEAKRSPSPSPSTSTIEEVNENVVGPAVQPVFASTVNPARNKASVAPAANSAALPNTPSPPRAAVSITSSALSGVDVGTALECVEEESKAAEGKIVAGEILTELEFKAGLGPLGRQVEHVPSPSRGATSKLTLILARPPVDPRRSTRQS